MAMHYQGFEVEIFEKVNEFQRLGDSLGLGENALRLLERWGLHDELVALGNKSEFMQIRHWETGEVLAQQPAMDMAGYIGHRGDYHQAFLNRVAALGVPLHMGCRVVAFDEDKPSITLANGQVHQADVIVAADGIKSLARELVLGFEDKPKSSGYACYRAYFPGAFLKKDPLCREFVEKDCINIWIGHDVHLVQNTLRDGDEFNWILTHKDTQDITESWFQPGNMNEVKDTIQTLDPRIAAAVRKTKECLDWKICYRDPIPSWVSKSHRIALLGDSCHPHLPTSAQGASQATESAAVLALCLKLAKDNVPLATRVYERLRFDRVRRCQRNGEDIRDRWHNALKQLQDGETLNPEDVMMRNRWLYPFDAEADTLERWAETAAVVEQELEQSRISPLFS
ncbi:hypothetical protein BDV18DRAFT_167069 [Aspergillus unguis]